jgi:mRNA interferase MazF
VNGGEYVPDRGDVVWIDLNPVAGHEQAGRRPAVVLSPRRYNSRTDLMLICPITRQVKGYIFEVSLPENLAVQGAVLADQVRSVDWRLRRVEFITRLPADVTEAVQGKSVKLITGDVVR